MQHDKVLHLNERLFSSEVRLTEPQTEGSDLVPTPSRKPKVYTVPAVGGGTVTDTPEVNSGQSMGATAPAGNSLKTSEDKDTQSLTEEQISGGESSLQPSDGEVAEVKQPSVQESIQTTSAEVNTEPTPAQAEAGNYKKGHDAPLSLSDMGATDNSDSRPHTASVDADKLAGESTPRKKSKWISDEDAAEFDELRNGLRSHLGESKIVEEPHSEYGHKKVRKMQGRT